MNRPSQPAPQTRAFQSWQLVFIAVMLLAAVAISTFYFSSAQAQTDNGTITGLTLSSDTPGTLAVSWESASPTPTDYRVDWAKSDEDYQSWKVDDGHKYPAPTAKTVTIADLEHDTEYKIRMRARYYRGEHEGKSWGGPWATATITVAGEPAETPTPEPVEEEPAETPTPEPAQDEQGKKESGQRPPRSDPPRDDPAPEDTTPAAPSLINTAVTEGQVLLSWSNPADDSITGYQILRGPDADSLVVIEDDTESSSTSYTDTAPPAGQTHTYGVKARNSAGLSPAGTATATVPEVLITARHGSTGNTLVSNLGQTAISIRAVVGTHVNFVHERAMSFTTGNNPYGYHLTNSQLYLRMTGSSNDPIPGVSIRNDNEGVPGQTVLYTMTTTSTIAGHFRLITFTTTDDFTLQPNTKYWLYVTINDGEAIGIQQTQSDDENVESNTDWEIGDSSYRAIDGAAWTEEHGENIRMNISGHPAPAFLVSNLDSPSTLVLFSRRTDADVSKFAQAFSAANNENGTPAEFDFHGVIVQLESDFSTASQLADSDILVTVHKDSGGQPSDLVYTLTSPATYTVPVPSGPVTFLAPPGSTLSSGITYWLKFEIATDSTFFTGLKRIDFEFATDNNEVQGPTTNNRWSIGDDSLWSPETLSWMDDSQSIQMSVLGAPHYDTLVSNIDQPTLPLTLFVGPGYESAQSFHIPSGPLGQQYRLSSVRIIATSENPTHASVDLHADHNGTPGSHLASLTTPGDFAPGLSVKADFIAVAPRGTLLNTDTRYWIVFRNEQNLAYFDIQTTPSKTEDLPSLDGWTIGDRKVSKFPNQPWRENPNPIKMELLGTPSLRTDEADGPDLPGAGHNAHKTGAVVTPGIVSTGHLTPGLDRNHGLYGDYWWLDTETGHRYRIEVKFGDSQNNDTGGSAWMSFIDPDHDDYPYASGCCEADHNRDDGHTFVHFRRPTDDWNNRYLVHIAAFDKLNHNSNIYNGPYTITMTDITGTEKVATNLYLGTRTRTHLPVSSGNVKFAVSFTTGDHPGGYYKLDRVRMHVPGHEGKPELTLHVNTSGAPGAIICGFRDPNKVEHHRPYAVNPLPVSFLAEHCIRDALAANTTYWLVLGGSGYFPALTDSDNQQTSRSGWTIGDVAAIKASGSWNNNNNNDTIPVEIWASPAPPPNRLPAGVPLIHGERRVGETLTADITGITDPEGLSDPRFTYSWIRVDGVDEKSIMGEESDTYTLTDDDTGQRIKALVTFYDDDEVQETAVGPTTSFIVPEAARILVGNFNQTSSSSFTTTDISNGFVSGAHPHGYAIDEIVFRRVYNTPASSDEAEFRLYTSTSNTDARERKPDTRIMTVSGPNRVVTSNIWFNAQSRVKLEPSTTYHAVLTTTSASDVIGCSGVTGGGEDSNSLEGFDIIDRHYVYPDSDSGFTDDRSCTILITGFELATSNLVQSLKFTSSPTQPDMYTTGELIEATATLTQAIAFDGPPPVILLQIGDNERRMEYFTSESTDTSWVFRYTVVADDRDDDGVSIKHNALRGYAYADLSHYGIINDQAHHVNAAPRVVSHRVSSIPLARIRYGPGEEIQFTLEFSLPVTVVGNPRLEFKIDTPASQNEFASYLSGSGTRELVFSYTVLTVDEDLNGIEWGANSLQLVDGIDEITGVYNGLAAILDHTTLNRLQGHRINQTPWPVSQDVTSDPTHGMDSDTYGAGDVITLTVVFNQVVTVTGAPQLRFRIGSSRNAAYVSGSGTNTLVFSYTVLATDIEPDSIHLFGTAFEPFNYPDAAADSIVGTSNNLPAVNTGIGKAGSFPGHKVDGSLTN